MLRYAANISFLWPELPLLNRIDAASRAGFKAVEMHWPYDTPAREFRDRCNRLGMKVLSLNTARGDVQAGEFGLAALPGREAEFQSSFDQALEYCLAIGGAAIHCMAGRTGGLPQEDARRTLIENLEEASSKALPHGVALLVEPINQRDVPGYFYSTAADAASIMEAVDRSNIRLMFDCYHLALGGADVAIELERFLPIIGHVQIAAVPTRAEPDDSDLDYRDILVLLDRLGYAGWVGCEYKPRTTTEQGLSWLPNLGLRL
ncbi:hydroxypyruvate isomerase [Rhodoligotrophos appendicifer]|uniref:hydroxypyruvate isomerase family protein n=1 Tax=Rhodoligotrophos appendicifer TaxID=987056 RepID=UPI00117D43AB|nr:TIM barrel protein [Rhodoligotrophos appendicifer]